MDMKTITSVAILFLATMFLHAASETMTGGKKAMMAPDDMRKEVRVKAERVGEIERIVKGMQNEAENEKDIKWKVCLTDILATIRGLAASIQAAHARMEDLIRAEREDAAQTQVMLVRGLADAAEKALAEAQACPRQLTRVDNKSSVEKEQKKEVTGTHSEKDSIGDAMGQNFASEWASERDPNNLGTEDPMDAAGADNPGGPTETPGQSGSKADSVIDHGDTVSFPPFVEASPEK